MKLISVLISFLTLRAVVAAPQENFNVLDKRRSPTCTSYSSANSLLTKCQTRTAFCTNYLGRSASIKTVYTTTSTLTVTPAPVVVTKPTATSTSYTTVYTTTVVAVVKVVRYSTTTTTVTAYSTTTVPVRTTSVESDTLTISTTAEDVVTTTEFVVVPECTSVVRDQKRGAAVPPGPSCGLSTISSSAISGACSCLLDTTARKATTTTTTLPASSTTTYTPVVRSSTISTATTSTSTSTITSAKTTTRYITSKTTAYATSTVVITTNIATTTTTVSTITDTDTVTTTSTSSAPQCTDSDINTYNNDTFESFCNKSYPGYVAATVDATDYFDCLEQCNSFNRLRQPYSCVGVTFYNTLCNQNCELKQGIDTNSIIDDSDAQSARLLSPAIGQWGNTCLDDSTTFGDIYQTDNSSIFTALCGMDSIGYDIYCQYDLPESYGDGQCFNDCTTNYQRGQCKGAVWVSEPPTDSYYCCAKFDHPSQAYEVSKRFDVDFAVLLIDPTTGAPY